MSIQVSLTLDDEEQYDRFVGDAERWAEEMKEKGDKVLSVPSRPFSAYIRWLAERAHREASSKR